MLKTSKSLVSIFPIPIMPTKFKLRISLKFFWFFIFLIIFSLLIVSVYQLNAYTSEIYLTRTYEKRVNELSLENKALEVELAKANSLWNIGQYAQNFERIDKIEYLRILESTALAK